MSLAKRNGNVDVSVLVPAKDEAENLPEFVEQRADALSDVPYSCDVVIVNDGSVNDTASILASLAEQHDVLRVGGRNNKLESRPRSAMYGLTIPRSCGQARSK